MKSIVFPVSFRVSQKIREISNLPRSTAGLQIWRFPRSPFHSQLFNCS